MSGLGFLFIVLTLAGMLCAFTFSCRPAHGGQPPVSAGGMAGLNREQIGEMLTTIDNAPPPEERMGAMCYDMVGPPSRAEFVCPACAGRTLYTNDVAYQLSWVVDESRRLYPDLRDASSGTVTLDETQFCRHCCPAVTNPSLVLVVKYSDDREVRTEKIRSDDLRLLTDFFRGKLTYTTDNEGEIALHRYRDRLRELLGVEPEP